MPPEHSAERTRAPARSVVTRHNALHVPPSSGYGLGGGRPESGGDFPGSRPRPRRSTFGRRCITVSKIRLHNTGTQDLLHHDLSTRTVARNERRYVRRDRSGESCIHPGCSSGGSSSRPTEPASSRLRMRHPEGRGGRGHGRPCDVRTSCRYLSSGMFSKVHSPVAAKGWYQPSRTRGMRRVPRNTNDRGRGRCHGRRSGSRWTTYVDELVARS